METTIQLNKYTVQVLKDLKRKFSMRSYDELINKLIHKQTRIPKSMFGSNPKLSSFREEERLKLREH